MIQVWESSDILYNDIRIDEPAHVASIARREPCMGRIGTSWVSRNMKSKIATKQVLGRRMGRIESDQRTSSWSVGVFGAAHFDFWVVLRNGDIKKQERTSMGEEHHATMRRTYTDN